jgi:hypothetical protein
MIPDLEKGFGRVVEIYDGEEISGAGKLRE